MCPLCPPPHQVDCPIASANLVMQLLDADAGGSKDAIYDPEVVPLDHQVGTICDPEEVEVPLTDHQVFSQGSLEMLVHDQLTC